MGGEEHDDFESRTGGVEHYSCMDGGNGNVQEVRKAKKEAMKM